MVQGVNQFSLQNLQLGKKQQPGALQKQQRKQEEYSAALAPQFAGFRLPQSSGVGPTQGVSQTGLAGVSQGQKASPQFGLNNPRPAEGMGNRLLISA